MLLFIGYSINVCYLLNYLHAMLVGLLSSTSLQPLKVQNHISGRGTDKIDTQN